MSREIIFRGRDYNGKWHYGLPIYLVEENCDDGTIDGIIPTNWFDGNIDVDPETVCQFTGLRDKNGELKVFESDKVKYRYWIQTSIDPDSEGRQFVGVGIIVFIEGSFMVEDIETKHRIPLHYQDLTIEIIGNMFESN